jgi:farnesyl-diphosphate farnesyltransferase
MTDRGQTATRLDVLLTATSRTFALSIPVLPEPTRQEVTIAYLLFRIADTLEDATQWSVERKERELSAFRKLMVEPSPDEAERLAASWAEAPPLDHASYLELLAETPAVIEAFEELGPGARASIRGLLLRRGRDRGGDADGALRARRRGARSGRALPGRAGGAIR